MGINIRICCGMFHEFNIRICCGILMLLICEYAGARWMDGGVGVFGNILIGLGE